MVAAREYIIAALVVTISTVTAGAQVLDTLPFQRPNHLEGTHFFVAYMQNEIAIPPSGMRLRLLIASAYPNTVTIVFPDGQQHRHTLRAYETLPLLLPDTLEVRQTETSLKRAVEIRAELPVSVFAMSSQYTSSDSYTALPVEMWGTEYTVLSLPNDTYSDGLGTPVEPLDIRQSEFMVIAKEDNTRLQFFPTVPTEGGRAPNQWHEVVLQRGECYLVKSYPLQQGQGDLTGTMVRADKPIAVLSGHVRASVPIGLPTMLDSKDHLVEMLLPNNVLGSSYVTVPFATGGRIPAGDYLRAVALYPDTRITIYTERDDIVHVLANPGDTFTLPRVNSPTWWYGTKPFALVQYMTTGTIANSIMFDPSMVIATPIGRYISRAVFQAPANLNDATFARQFDRHWLNVICDERARLSLKLDGKYVAAAVAPELATQKFRSSGMFWAQIPVTPGIHALEADSGTFTGVLYGMGYTDSYAHIIGMASFAERDTVLPSINVRDSCAWLLGEATDHGGSGIAYVVVDPDSTRNYDFTVEPQQNRIAFRAAINDPTVDASIAVIARDRAGNGVRYRYRYTAPIVDFSPRPLRFVASSRGEVVCQDAAIRNFSFSDTVVVHSIRFAQGSSGAFQVQNPSTPLACLPRREAKVRICFTAGQEGTLRDTLLWDLGCGRIYRQPINATVSLPALSIADIDFGAVAVGDTACRQLQIVNSGTEVLRITSISEDSRGVFVVESAVLPQILQPGDTLAMRACFIPRDTGDVQMHITVSNDKGIEASAVFRGRGIRAFLVAEPLDCGSRRVGIRFDTVARISNRGNADAIIRYRAQNGDQTAFLHSYRTEDPLVVPKGGSVTIPIRFSPSRVGLMTGELEFATEDNRMLVLPMRGLGTLPALMMRDTVVGPVKVGEQRTYAILLLRSMGNEPLTVDSLWFDGPDIESFRVETALSFPLVIPEEQSVVLPMTFFPRRSGNHTVVLFIRHDAAPNYLRQVSSMQLRGIAIERDTGESTTDSTELTDTLDFRLSVDYTPAPHQCGELTLFVMVSNTGNNALHITNADLVDGGSRTSIRQRFPAQLFPGETVRLKITIPPPQQERDILLRIVANDTIVRQQIVHVEPVQGTVTVSIEDLVGAIDSLVYLTVRGSIANGHKAAVRATLDVRLPITLAEYRGGFEVPIQIQYDGSQTVTAATVGFTHAGIMLQWDLPAFSTTCLWQAEIPLRLLYSLTPIGEARAIFSAGECYRSDSARSVVATHRVCGHNLRAVELGGLVVQTIAPNPFDEKIHVEANVLSPQALRLYAYDLQGRWILLGVTEYLDVGHRVVIFDAKQLPSGWYMLTLETSDGRQYHDCCYIKY